MTTTLITDSIHRRPVRRGLAAAAGTAILALALSACGSSDTDTPDTTPTPEPTVTESDEPTPTPAEETDSPLPRLVVAHDGSVSVIDTSTLTVLETFDTEGRAYPAVGSDDRHVYLAQYDNGDVLVLDSGSYATAHGDHAHYYVREPALRDVTIEATKPSHVVAHGDRTAVFDDGTGTISVFRDAGLLAGGLDVQTIDGTPHHGVAVPIDDGELLVSTSSDGEGADAVARVSETGDVIATSPACAGLHGEATTEDAVAFGCTGSVLVYHDEDFHSIDLPAADGRVSTLSGTHLSDVLLGNYSETEVVLIDVEDESVEVVDLGVAYTSFARGAHGEALVLGADGAIHVIDPETGDVTASVPAIEAFTIDSDWTQPRPAFVVLEHTAYVTDVAGSRIVAIDLDEGTVLGEVALDSAPFGLVATNTAWLHGGAHDHEDDHDHEEDDHDHEGDHDHDDHDHDDDHDDHDH